MWDGAEQDKSVDSIVATQSVPTSTHEHYELSGKSYSCDAVSDRKSCCDGLSSSYPTAIMSKTEEDLPDDASNSLGLTRRRFSVTRVPERSALMSPNANTSSALVDRLSRKSNKNLKILTKPVSSAHKQQEPVTHYAQLPVEVHPINDQSCSFYNEPESNLVPVSAPALSSSSTSSPSGVVFGNQPAKVTKSYADANSLTWGGTTAAKSGFLSSINETTRTRRPCAYYPAAELFLRQGSNSPCSTVRSDRSSNSIHFQDDYLVQRKLAGGGMGRVSSTATLPSLSYSSAGESGWEDAAMANRFASSFSSQVAAKHVNTEHFMAKYGYKSKLAKYQGYLDRTLAMIQSGSENVMVQGLDTMAKVMDKAWTDPKFGHDLAYSLCDYVRDTGFMAFLLNKYLVGCESPEMQLSIGAALEQCLSGPNRNMVVKNGYLEPIVRQACKLGVTGGEPLRISLSLLESLLKHTTATCTKVIELGGLDHIITACKTCTDTRTMRHAALALSNLAMFGGPDNMSQLLGRNVPEWLFLLASMQDDLTRYYACLAICILVSNPEIEAAVVKSGTLGLVEPFLLSHRPDDFASCDLRHQQGRPVEWLEKLVPLLRSKRRETRSIVAYHFLMEAAIKKKQEKLHTFQKIEHLVENLKELASSPDEVPANFASEALLIIGETVPHKLSEDVPLWKAEDVKFWVTKIGFANYADNFYQQQVDGDLLLLITEEELKEDIGIKSSLLRRRFLRELKALKIGADYGCIDESRLDKFLMSISPDFSVYTYRMIEAGVDRQVFPRLNDALLLNDCHVKNRIHRMKILEAIEDVRHIEDMDLAILRKNVDIFVSYRRSTGSQLASLLRVLLQLRGYKVFIDVDRLYAGQFDSSLLMNIKAAKHFVLILSPQALDRCIGDHQCEDWIHKEIKCALENDKNIIPVLAPCFEWPDDNALPDDMSAVRRFNSVQWVHEYQEACVDKIDKFLKAELNSSRSQQRQNSAARGSLDKFTIGSPRPDTPLQLTPPADRKVPDFSDRSHRLVD